MLVTRPHVTNDTLTSVVVTCTLHPMEHPPIYYTVRSCVRWVFWTTVAMALMLAALAIGNATSKPIPDCEYFHYPCETPTTVYDPYGYNPYGVAP